MIQRFETFVTAITQIYRSIQRLKSQEMAPFGLKGTHVMCLFQLQKHPEGLTSAQLSQLCEEDKAAISRAVAELREQNLIESPSLKEHRNYRSPLTLTEQGREITQRMDQKILNAVRTAAQGYSAEERSIFYHVLLQIADNLQEASTKSEENSL